MIVFVGIAVIVGVVKFKETKSMAADGKMAKSNIAKLYFCHFFNVISDGSE